MDEKDNVNKRVAKNAIALTLRMVLVTIVGLFTSRIVLQALGIDNYGIYGVVGGLVGMASFLNTSMAGATSRFITFELGNANTDKLKKIFSTALAIHLALAVFVIVLAESLGLWFLNNHMVIPHNRMYAANVLYQFTILSVIIGFTQVPYSADIIAHEKMSIYAYFEIINVVLKLGVVYLLLLFKGDRLIIYSILIFIVTLINAIFYRGYCIKHFPESRVAFHFDKSIAKPMLKFSGFDLYGNMSVAVKNQGQPIVLNLFFGVVANAGSSIAYTVVSAVQGLTASVSQAFRPQIIKNYASGDTTQMYNIMKRSNEFTILAFSIVSIPVFLETSKFLKLWLGQLPMYSVEFLRIIIITALFKIIVDTSNMASHAVGQIKYISFINGTFFLLCPVISYIILKNLLLNVAVIYLVDLMTMLVLVVIGFGILKKLISEFPIQFYIESIIKSLSTVLMGFFLTWLSLVGFEKVFSDTTYSSFLGQLVYLGCLVVWCGIIMILLNYIVVMGCEDRAVFKQFLRKYLRILNKSIR